MSSEPVAGGAWSSSRRGVTCALCGQSWPRDPALEVPCPTCHARVGVWCKSPSGHKAMNLHAARDRAAIEAGKLHVCKSAPPAHRDGLFAFDWRTIGAALGVRVGLRREPLTFPCVSLTWPDGTQALLCDNGGEWNLTVREPEPVKIGPWAWEPGYSMAYTGVERAPFAVAYRVLCHVEGREVDYQFRPSNAEEALDRADASPFADGWVEARTCSCTRRSGAVVGVVCLSCQLARGPLPAMEEP